MNFQNHVLRKAKIFIVMLALLLTLPARPASGRIFVEAGQERSTRTWHSPAGLAKWEWARILAQLPLTVIEDAILHATDSQSFDRFGFSVAIDGDTVIVGAFGEDGGPGDPLPGSGTVYVFERNLGGSGNWGEAAILYASDAQIDDSFGSRVAIDGDTVIVGAGGEDGGPGDPLPGAGAAYVFERNLGGPGNWGEAAILHASDAQANDAFANVAISGDTVIVGAQLEDGGPGDPLEDAGTTYVFERDLGGPGNWGEAAILHASDAQASDYFATSVAISGDTIIVGAFGEDGGPGNPLTFAGAGYVFERNLGGPGNWGEAAILHASDVQSFDSFGNSVAIDGDTIIVGAGPEDGGPGDPLPGAGAAYVFERNLGGPENWGEAVKLTASDAQAHDAFGNSIAISGDSIIVGASLEDGDQLDNGAAYVFERNLGGPGNWGEAAKLIASDAQANDAFGNAVAISGDTIIAGAYQEDGDPGNPLPEAGAAYIYKQLTQQVYLPLIER